MTLLTILGGAGTQSVGVEGDAALLDFTIYGAALADSTIYAAVMADSTIYAATLSDAEST
mgnify:CR=1 FL=1